MLSGTHIIINSPLIHYSYDSTLIFLSLEKYLTCFFLFWSIICFFFPQFGVNFRKTLEFYSEDMRNVAVSIVRFITMGLGLEAQKFCDTFKEGTYEIRMNCYPPCPEPERVIGLNPHADISGITLLLECGDTPGLQVLKDEHWVNVEPVNGAIVVNLGNIMEVNTMTYMLIFVRFS